MIRYAIVALLLATTCVRGQDAGELEALIRKLGARDFKERQAAGEALLMIGSPAEAALTAALKNPEPEIRMRAAELLKDLRSGVNASWPKDVQDQIRRFGELSRADKHALISRLHSEYDVAAAPFFLRLVEKGDKDDAQQAVVHLADMKDKRTVFTTILERYAKPKNPSEAECLVSAAYWSKDPEKMALVLASEHVKSDVKAAVLKKAIETIRGHYEKLEYKDALRTARVYAKGIPDDARFLYLEALALTGLGREDAAAETVAKALALNPDKEGPHYTVGQMLMDMECYDLAELEWKTILEIPPKDEVYDLNAYIRLGTIRAQAKEYKKAADMLEMVAKKYRQAKEKHGSSMGMVGADDLPRMIARYRRLADEADAVDDALGRMTLTIKPSVKQGKGKELEAALKDVVLEMRSNVEPYGFRLFEEAPAGLQYDHAKQELSIVLNGSSCGQSQKYKLKDAEAQLALHTLDMSYIFKVNRDTGNSEKMKSFEKDYKVSVERGPKLLLWDQAELVLDGKKYSWQELAKGVPFDYLPKKLEMEIKGTRPDGEKMELKMAIDPAQFMRHAKKETDPTVISLKIEQKQESE